jgi:hypothetical protein
MTDPDAPVPYWPAYLPIARAEAANAVQFWPTSAAERLADAEQEWEATG